LTSQSTIFRDIFGGECEGSFSVLELPGANPTPTKQFTQWLTVTAKYEFSSEKLGRRKLAEQAWISLLFY